ncbi:hypothetical protein [Bacillus subtilis]|uniref:hypothetical protein n=1 Tax=Bacillus subtilis TaxID=1423 RepID=UPI003F838078
MVSKLEIDSLVERLKSDASNRKGEDAHSWGLYDYLEQILKDDVLSHPAAIGSAKQAVNEGINSLSDAQLKALALDMLDNDLYMEECPNEWCGEKIAWGDMSAALEEGQCSTCVYQQEKIEQE